GWAFHSRSRTAGVACSRALANERSLRERDDWSRRIAADPNCNHERRKLAGNRPFPSDTDRRALHSEVTHNDALPVRSTENRRERRRSSYQASEDILAGNR